MDPWTRAELNYVRVPATPLLVVKAGKVGRPRLVLPAGVMIARVLERYQRRRVVEVLRHVIVGSQAAVISRVIGTQLPIRALINTSYTLSAFRARLAPLARRTRAGAHKHCTLEAGMWLVGACYNFLWKHRSRGGAHTGNGSGNHGPSLVAGGVLLIFPVPPAELPRWRGRKPRWLLEAERSRWLTAEQLRRRNELKARGED